MTTGILISVWAASTLHVHAWSMALFLQDTQVTPQKPRFNGTPYVRCFHSKYAHRCQQPDWHLVTSMLDARTPQQHDFS